MLYQTHKKFAQLFGVTGITYAFSTSLLPTFDWSYGVSDNILVGTLILMAYSASTFGGEFPDIDSATSIPARRYPFLRRVFKMFGIDHRGKFSHDFTSLAILFGSLMLLTWAIFTFFWNSWLAMLLVALYIIYFYGREIGNDLVFKMTRGEDARKRMRMPYIIVSALVVLVLFALMGWFPYSGGATTLLRASSALKPMMYTTVGFAWVGAYSHLFADMLTNEGVYLLWHKLSPARWVMRLNKIPFLIPLILLGLGWVFGDLVGAGIGLVVGLFLQFLIAKTDLKTGSEYEKLVRRLVKVLLVPAVALLIYTAFGGVVM